MMRLLFFIYMCMSNGVEIYKTIAKRFLLLQVGLLHNWLKKLNEQIQFRCLSIVAALTNFSQVLNLLQMDIMRQHMNMRPGLLGRAPSLPASPLMNPDLQIAILAVLLAQQIQVNQPQFVSNPLTQQYILNFLGTQERSGMQVRLCKFNQPS